MDSFAINGKMLLARVCAEARRKMMACLDIISTFFTSFLLLFCICPSLSHTLLEDRVPFAEITKERQASDFCLPNKQFTGFHYFIIHISMRSIPEKL